MPGTTVAAGLCGARECLTRALALEPAPIRVDAVSPGAVRTDLWRELPETDREGLFASAAQSQSQPVGRIGEPEDVAKASLYRDPLPRSAPQPALKCTCAVVTTVPRRGKSRRTDASCSGAVRAAIASSANTRS